MLLILKGDGLARLFGSAITSAVPFGVIAQALPWPRERPLADAGPVVENDRAQLSTGSASPEGGHQEGDPVYPCGHQACFRQRFQHAVQLLLQGQLGARGPSPSTWSKARTLANPKPLSAISFRSGGRSFRGRVRLLHGGILAAKGGRQHEHPGPGPAQRRRMPRICDSVARSGSCSSSGVMRDSGIPEIFKRSSDG